MKKGLVLMVVIGVVLIIFTLAIAALHLMTQESRIAEHKIRRARAFYAVQAGMVLVLERLRTGVWGYSARYCISNGVAPMIGGCAAIVVDANIPYDVQIDVGALGSGIGPTARIDIEAVY